MDERKQTLRRIAIFLLLTFALSTIFYALRIFFGGYFAYLTGLMWSPAIAAFITQRVFRRDVGEFGWKWGKTKYQLLGYALPFLYISAAYGVIWIAGLGGFYDEKFVGGLSKRLGINSESPGLLITIYVLLQALFGLVQTLVPALGEEIGWRGFLVPQLAQITTFTKTALISGIIWAVWHYPIFLLPNFQNTFDTWYSLSCFTLMVINLSFITAWLRLRSGSLWATAFLHATHNLLLQNVFNPLTKDTGKTLYYADETGIVLVITTLLVALFFWRRAKDLEAENHLSSSAN
jgi:membrane protease YdiL (CAAX protease family)